MKAVLGTLCLIGGALVLCFVFFDTDRAVETFRLTGDNAPVLAQWLGMWIWVAFSIIGAVLFTASK